MTISQEEVIRIVAKTNPNNADKVTEYAIQRVENKLHESISWLHRIKKDKPEEEVARIVQAEKYHHLLLNCCERLSTSYLLRPINGLVIHKDRIIIGKFLKKAEEIRKELKGGAK
jgi:hypothetical protein